MLTAWRVRDVPLPQCMKHLASLGLLNESQLIQAGYGNPLNLIHEDFRRPIPESPVDIRLSENRLTFTPRNKLG
jgi:hypothetical protein